MLTHAYMWVQFGTFGTIDVILQSRHANGALFWNFLLKSFHVQKKDVHLYFRKESKKIYNHLKHNKIW